MEEQNLSFKQQDLSEDLSSIIDNPFKEPEPQINNSISPSIAEIERFILFLNKRFELGLSFEDITILISESKPSIKGFYAPKGKYENTTQKLRAINLNPINLKNNPYETIAHELAHFYNDFNNIEDCKSNQYHNKHFKEQAEKLLLIVSRTNKGYNQTEPSEAFNKMLQEEFKPSSYAFHINQITNKNKTKPSRLLKFVCDCGYIIRASKNESKPLKAICEYCNTEFKQAESED